MVALRDECARGGIGTVSRPWPCETLLKGLKEPLLDVSLGVLGLVT